jgi:hypothetical protein
MEYSMAKYKKEDIIDSIVKMRIEKMAATKTIIRDYLMGELGYGQAYAYELLREARAKIVEYYGTSNTASLEEAIGQLEEMAEDAKQSKNYKLAFNIRQELSKIQGHYKERIELSGDVNHKIEVIKLIGPEEKKDE